MQRKRGELVPIGEVVGELDGPVTAIPATSPQARHHFTRFDQVDQLVGASEADADLGFMQKGNFGFEQNRSSTFKIEDAHL